MQQRPGKAIFSRVIYGRHDVKRFPMLQSRLLLSAIAITALVGIAPAGAFTVQGPSGVNAGSAAQFVDPDKQVEHIANGDAPELGASWADREIIPSNRDAATSAAPPAPQWAKDWHAPSLIIGDRWTYPARPR
jgi:hypothetical protein